MSAIFPEGHTLKNALSWATSAIAEQHEKAANSRKVAEIAEEACLRFDLSPKDSDFLIRLLNNKTEKVQA